MYIYNKYLHTSTPEAHHPLPSGVLPAVAIDPFDGTGVLPAVAIVLDLGSYCNDIVAAVDFLATWYTNQVLGHEHILFASGQAVARVITSAHKHGAGEDRRGKLDIVFQGPLRFQGPVQLAGRAPAGRGLCSSQAGSLIPGRTGESSDQFAAHACVPAGLAIDGVCEPAARELCEQPGHGLQPQPGKHGTASTTCPPAGVLRAQH